MLIMRVAGFDLYEDGIIPGADYDTLRQLDDLLLHIEAQQAHRTARFDERCRQTRRLAFKRGYREGRASALQQHVCLDVALEMATNRIKERIQSMVEEEIHRLMEQIPSVSLFAMQLHRGIDALHAQHILAVRVPDEAVEEARSIIAEIGRELGAAPFSVMPDATLPKNSCVIETSTGVVDGGLRRQLQAARDGIASALSGDIDALVARWRTQ